MSECICCKWVKPFKTPPSYKNFKNKRSKNRAGVILIHEKEKMILLVQVYDSYVGFPKGHSEGNETSIQNAIRELKEETGIEFDENFKYQKCLKYNSCTYFVKYVDEMYKIDTVNGQDVTSSGWTHIDCVRNIKFITSHVKKFIETL